MATAYDYYGRGAAAGQGYKQLVFPLDAPLAASLPPTEDKTGLVDDLAVRRLRRLRPIDVRPAAPAALKAMKKESAVEKANQRRAQRRSRAIEEGMILAGLFLLTFLTVQTSLRLGM